VVVDDVLVQTKRREKKANEQNSKRWGAKLVKKSLQTKISAS
jgi:hypothetical protein